MPHPISPQCGKDKKLSADEVASERQEGIPREIGASESPGIVQTVSSLFSARVQMFFSEHIIEKLEKK